MKNKDIYRFRLLYRLLDESGLDWLSAEVRLFAVTPSSDEDSNYQLEARGNFNKADDQINLKIDKFLSSQDSPVNSNKSYDDCIQYTIDRIENLVAYMEGAISFANELGIRNVQLGQEKISEYNIFEIKNQLKDIEKTLREMVLL
jgi:hypothetical protein